MSTAKTLSPWDVAKSSALWSFSLALAYLPLGFVIGVYVFLRTVRLVGTGNKGMAAVHDELPLIETALIAVILALVAIFGLRHALRGLRAHRLEANPKSANWCRLFGLVHGGVIVIAVVMVLSSYFFVDHGP